MSQPPWPLRSSLVANPLILPGRSAAEAAKGQQSRTRRAEDAGTAAADPLPIIAFSHLSWDWVWQRPQQFLSRFGRQHRVLFVETYCSDVAETRVITRVPDGFPKITVLQMHLPAAHWHDGAYVDAERRRALQAALTDDLRGEFQHPLLWFYDPMAVVAFAGHLGERGIVYDCMDELSQFRGAPAELVVRERELLQVADVVFCGGQKMRKKRLPLNPNTHFYGTGVDVTHFGAALSDSLALAPEIAALNGAPVLGYFGVVDERMDYELLAKLADARADWHIVIVGPVAKVNPAEFPQRRNLHWLGGRKYEQLPALTKGFSVAMMPFALNAATEYINPTKALEYMAAGRPVVSTALDEVKMNFGSVARIARTHAEFIELCAGEVAKPSRARIERGLALAAENTWEAIVARMEVHIAEALAAPPAEENAAAKTIAPATLPKLAYV